MEKHVYLVRHGESEENAGRVIFGREAALTELGRKQADVVGERIGRIGVEAVFSSTFPRAIETARAIAPHVGKEPEQNALLGEHLLPSRVHGMHLDHPEVRTMFTELYGSNDPHYRNGDEETFAELAARAQATLEFFESHEASRLCAVTHGIFLRMLVGVVCFGKLFTREQWNCIRFAFQTTNTGITYIRRDDTGAWKLITWNDQAHLG